MLQCRISPPFPPLLASPCRSLAACPAAARAASTSCTPPAALLPTWSLASAQPRLEPDGIALTAARRCALPLPERRRHVAEGREGKEGGGERGGRVERGGRGGAREGGRRGGRRRERRGEEGEGGEREERGGEERGGEGRGGEEGRGRGKKGEEGGRRREGRREERGGEERKGKKTSVRIRTPVGRIIPVLIITSQNRQ